MRILEQRSLNASRCYKCESFVERPAMGGCFGMFKKRPNTNTSRLLGRCLYHHDRDKVELQLLVDGGMDAFTDEDSLEVDVWTTSRRSHQLLALDAHSLLATRALQKRTASCCSSTPPSSIDLEWEIESVLQPATRPKSLPSSHVDDGSSGSGGGGGSPESLEWDPCDQHATDYETEQLIHEIEILTRRALQETGDWTKTGS